MIYAAIVVIWAVVLVPMWLRRHDSATESRSVDKFAAAMRTLSRRTSSTPDKRYVVMPRRLPDSVSWHVSGSPTPASPRAGRSTTAAAPQEDPARVLRPVTARSRLLARRRRLAAGLGGGVVLTALLVVVGAFPWPLQLLLDLALAGYAVHLRGEARRAAAVSRHRRRATAVPREYRGDVVADEADQVLLTEPLVGQELDPAVGYGDSWDPVPVPPPTYVTKSQAGSPEAPQTIVDLTQAGTGLIDDLGLWEDDEDELDVIVERRRAVGD
ncbi:MAG TPA: hypothetical protein VNG13_07630 [Mycobacteriales bacterium]|nr:hypothetical protein [Mycobacteriales bacterium]